MNRCQPDVRLLKATEHHSKPFGNRLSLRVLILLCALVALWPLLPAQSARASANAPVSDPCGDNFVNTGGGPCVSGPVQLSPREQAILKKKLALAWEYAQVRAKKLSFETFKQDYRAFIHQYGGANAQEPTFGVSPDVCCISNNVTWVQVPQKTSYYCGPATAYEVLVSHGNYIHPNGDSLSQDTLAGSRYLNTTTDGTSWSPGVMAPTLNAWVGWTFYVAVNGSGVGGGGFSTATWIYSLTEDIDNGWPLAGNTVEHSGTNSPHLTGHTTAVDIYHWIAIEGYTYSGNTTWYADSVHGTYFWNWAANVPAFSDLTSSDMTILLNGRGFIW